MRFETIHEETYRAFGFELVFIESASVLERVGKIKALIADSIPSIPDEIS
jgi:hypothetical protein